MAKQKAQNDVNPEAVPEGVGAFVVEIIKIFALAAVIIFPVRMFLFQPFIVQGASMAPNFHGGEYLIINEVGYKQVEVGLGEEKTVLVEPKRDLHRGDNVVFRAPENPKQFYIKRVIGLPGERVTVDNGVVKVFNEVYPDGFILDEHYLPENIRMPEDKVDLTMTAEGYFVMGDNRMGSHDSRAWGALPRDHVIGKVVVRLWPVNKFTVF